MWRIFYRDTAKAGLWTGLWTGLYIKTLRIKSGAALKLGIIVRIAMSSQWSHHLVLHGSVLTENLKHQIARDGTFWIVLTQ